MLVKALPYVGERHGEMVCCAGVTLDRKWRRQFPVNFRDLGDEKFKRWQWIRYDWRQPGADDTRRESQRVQEGTIRAGNIMPPKERATFLRPIVRNSVEEAAQLGQTLALIQPKSAEFTWKKKPQSQIDAEASAYAEAANQLSFFSEEKQPLDPCPYEFRFKYRTSDGKPHRNICGDWETSAAFFKHNRAYGEDAAINHLANVYNNEYPKRGMVFAMGTHSRHPNTWLLVGVIRLDETNQLQLI